MPATTASGAGNVVPLPTARIWAPSVKHRPHDPAGPALSIEIRPGEEIDYTCLLSLPNLWKPFVDAALAWNKGPEVTRLGTERAMPQRLRKGFCAYLVQSGRAELALEDLDTKLVNGFVTWLTAAKVRGNAVSHSQRSSFLGALRTVVTELRGIPSYAGRLPKALALPSNPWPGGTRSRTPTTVLQEHDWARLYEVCAAEVAELTQSVMSDWESIDEFIDTVRLDQESGYYRDRRVFIAALAKAFPGVVPERRKVITAMYPGIAVAFERFHTLATIRALCPTPQDVLPFVLLLEMYTQFNADLLLRLGLDSISRQEVLGVERIVLSPYKPRARRKQIRSFAVRDGDPTSPSSVIDFMIAWTKRIRVDAPKELRDRLFLFTPVTKTRDVTSYGKRNSEPSADDKLKHNLEAFQKKHGLPNFNLRELRATGLDFVHQLFGGDLRAVQAAGGQRRPQVILDHYTSDAALRRNEERLAEVMAVRERWQETNGKVDPRGKPASQDLGACTPGWRCADPYDSPIPGETPGRLCAAMGACPGCALAATDTTSPFALASLLTLKREIQEAQSYLPAQRWIDAWAPRLKRLNEYWLPSFTDPAVVEAAAKLAVPRLPRLD
ncbi:hypothetical protein GAY29_04080 [Azospirillum brasilense]|nr:hypothetical protein [Azospirillum brasilense]